MIFSIFFPTTCRESSTDEFLASNAHWEKVQHLYWHFCAKYTWYTFITKKEEQKPVEVFDL